MATLGVTARYGHYALSLPCGENGTEIFHFLPKTFPETPVTPFINLRFQPGKFTRRTGVSVRLARPGFAFSRILQETEFSAFSRKWDIPQSATTPNSDVPAALEAICIKAMAVKGADRYRTPRMLADDLEHWLADEPIVAMRDPLTIHASLDESPQDVGCCGRNRLTRSLCHGGNCGNRGDRFTE